MSSELQVSLIATVKDEIEQLDEWLTALTAQSRLPDQVVVVDGGSSDGTWERLSDWQPSFPVIVERVPGANISEGRNRAISLATGDIFVVTDAGTRADRHWIERLTAVLEVEEVDVAAGFFSPEGRTAWLRSLAATTLPGARDVRSRTFLPSSRSIAFRREWWLAGVRYPEWLDYCEDVVFDHALRRAGARFEFVPGATVSIRPRTGPRSFWLQYYRYARGDGKAGIFAHRHLVRYATWILAAIGLWRRRPGELVAGAVCACIYCSKPTRRLWMRDRAAGHPIRSTSLALPLIPIQRAIGDLAKMAGYPVGLRWKTNTFGRAGWRKSWRSVSPSGITWQLPGCATQTPSPTSWPDA